MRVQKLTYLIALISFSLPISAQSNQGSNILTTSLIVVGVVVFFGLLLSLADNLMQIEAKKNNLDTSKGQFSIFPRINDWFGSRPPASIGDAGYHNLSKGFDVKLAGKAVAASVHGSAKTFAVQPKNFNGMSPIPKVEVVAGDEVAVGDVLFFDKKRPDVKYCSPVSGEIISVNRGDKRSIASVVILADKEMKYRSLEIPSLDGGREDLLSFLKTSGTLTFMNQRPYDIIPEDGVVPDNIFVSGFDTAPLAPDNNFIVQGKGAQLQKGVDVLNALTDGKVYVGLDGRKGHSAAAELASLEGVEINYFNGKHPAGNVGIQIHHTAPIGKTGVAWTITVQELISLGEIFLTGKYNAERKIALTGSQLSENIYVDTYVGANIGELLGSRIEGEKNRFVSGDPLSGVQKASDEFLNYRDDQITVLEEGDDYELFGWLLPVTPRPSMSGTFPNLLFSGHEFDANTNTHGEKRAFVMTGQYEKVLPMDIFPQHLMKSILTGEIEKMEGLGIRELSEEDIAICEFVCTSKQPLQAILRDGLDMMQEQG